MGNGCPGCEEKERPRAVVLPSSSPAMYNNDKSNEFVSISIPPGRPLDHILTMAQSYTPHFHHNVTVDYSENDYRAFCLLLHSQNGALLLYCTRKKKKPPHYQLPGGHVDEAEFKQVSQNAGRFITQEQLYQSARLGCVREIYEETGIDLRSQLDRLRPMVLYNKFERGRLINEFKHRLFFVCEVQDDDFVVATKVTLLFLESEMASLNQVLCLNLISYYYTDNQGYLFRIYLSLALISFNYITTHHHQHPSGSVRYLAIQEDYSCDLTLQLSAEHQGFRFDSNPRTVMERLRHHSGGKVERAIGMAMNVNDVN